MINDLIYFIICLAVSAVGSVSGIGGGIIIKPIMDRMGQFSIPSVNFLSGCTILCMAGASLLRKEKNVKIQKNISALLATGACIGGIAGKELFHLIYFFYEQTGRQKSIGVIQTILLLLINTGILLYFFFKEKKDKKNKTKRKAVKSPAACIIIGFGLGLLSSFLGIGGGPVNVIALCYLFLMTPKETSVNSLFIIFCSQASSLAVNIITGTVPVFSWQTLAFMCFGGITGAFIGQLISKRINQYAVERLFVCVVVFLIALNIFNLAI